MLANYIFKQRLFEKRESSEPCVQIRLILRASVKNRQWLGNGGVKAIHAFNRETGAGGLRLLFVLLLLLPSCEVVVSFFVHFEALRVVHRVYRSEKKRAYPGHRRCE